MRFEMLLRLNVARRARRVAIVITDLAGGDSRLIIDGEHYAADPLAGPIARRFASGVSGVEPGSGELLVVHAPAIRLIVVGAVHITQALVPMAKLAGLEITVVDPRAGFASPERFPDAALVAEWPQDALPRLTIDRFTALAALSHVPEIDDAALQIALRAGCFYVGALGSRTSHARRLGRLAAAGFGEADLARIRAPIGLAIGAHAPAEIAVAILAEIIAERRRS
jgi:xanthine dehydrogenase accessory factor